MSIKEALSKAESRLIAFLYLASLFTAVLITNHISAEQYLMLMAMDGMLYKIIEKID